MGSPASDVLAMDPEENIAEISAFLRHGVHAVLRKRGMVVAVSGGLDSAVCASLCAKALGPSKVLCVSLPERHSSPVSSRIARLLAEFLRVQLITEDITPELDAAGTYARQLEALREVFPDAQSSWSFKIVLPSLLQGERLNVPRLTVQLPSGERRTERISPAAYRQLVAATSFKQRVRAMITYYHADRLHYAVCGTPNRLEYELGFFVKGGDGLSDDPTPQ